MEALQAVVLGVIQGITEFLPVSSSGHLIFVPYIFGWPDQGQAFDVMVHMGTLVAVCYYFRKKILVLAKAALSNKKEQKAEKKLAIQLILSIIPAAVVGMILGDYIAGSLRSASVVAVSLALWGVVLYFVDKNAKSGKAKETLSLTNKQALGISLAQVLALVPGTSRSGITMIAGLKSGLTRLQAAEFSFLMSIPVIAAAGAKKTYDLLQAGIENNALFLILGIIASAASGYFAISWLLRLVNKKGFLPFAVYRIVVALLILFFLV